MFRRLAVVGVVAVAGCGSSSGVPDRFSGTWRLEDGRTIPIRRVSAAEGRAAVRALHGRACAGAALYFRATYFDGGAHMAGCATGDGKRFHGRFDDRGMTGVLEQRLVKRDRFVGIVRGDAGARPFRIVATRIRH